jgi:hypothetical protein
MCSDESPATIEGFPSRDLILLSHQVYYNFDFDYLVVDIAIAIAIAIAVAADPSSSACVNHLCTEIFTHHSLAT